MVSEKILEHHRTLGLTHPSSLKEVQETYRKLASKNHPDKHPKEKEKYTELMKQINHARDVLVAHYEGTSEEVEDEIPLHKIFAEEFAEKHGFKVKSTEKHETKLTRQDSDHEIAFKNHFDMHSGFTDEIEARIKSSGEHRFFVRHRGFHPQYSGISLVDPEVFRQTVDLAFKLHAFLKRKYEKKYKAAN